MKKNKKQKGYTLLEILVVVVIIGVLTYASVPLYNKIINKSDVSDALHNIDMLSGAQDKYFLKNGGYTENLSKLDTPLRSDSEEILTAKFTYSAGESCIFAENNSKDYMLGKNYRTGSQVLCSGGDCNKISSFVKKGSLHELCGDDTPVPCDLTCRSPKVLQDPPCECVCPEMECGPNQMINQETCTCKCQPVSCPPHKRLAGDCTCKCPQEILQTADNLNSLCEGNLVFNENTCKCEEPCDLTDKMCSEEHDYNENFIVSSDCRCICGLNEKSCGEFELVLNEDKCICEPKPEGCEKTNKDCAVENGDNENFVINQDCKCVCGIDASSCSESETFDKENCICTPIVPPEPCAGISCPNENYILNPNDCTCECNITAEDCSEGETFVEEYCTCDSPDTVCPTPCLNGNYAQDPITCECTCTNGLDINSCPDDNTFDEVSCSCIPALPPEPCAGISCPNENEILNLETCKCFCGISQTDCLEGQIFVEEYCACKYPPVPNCDPCPNENFIQAEDCSCSCPLQCNALQVLDDANCSCKCKDIFSAICTGKKGLTSDCECRCKEILECDPGFVFNHDTCECECVIPSDEYRCLNFDTEKCECPGCQLTNEQCQTRNPNWVVLPNCTCGCPHEATCTPPYTYWDKNTCSCVGCNVPQLNCSRYGINYRPDPETCACHCILSTSTCGQLGLLYAPSDCACQPEENAG